MKSIRQHLTMAVVAVLLGTPSAVARADTGERASLPVPAFSELDLDQSGTISLEELKLAGDDIPVERLAELWSRLDTNQDGELQPPEFARLGPALDTGRDYRVHDESQ